MYSCEKLLFWTSWCCYTEGGIPLRLGLVLAGGPSCKNNRGSSKTYAGAFSPHYPHRKASCSWNCSLEAVNLPSVGAVPRPAASLESSNVFVSLCLLQAELLSLPAGLEIQAHEWKKTLEDFLCLCSLPKQESCSRWLCPAQLSWDPSSARSLGWCCHKGSVTALSCKGGVEKGSFDEDEQTLLKLSLWRGFLWVAREEMQSVWARGECSASSISVYSELSRALLRNHVWDNEDVWGNGNIWGWEFVVGFHWGLEQRLSTALPLPSCLCSALLALLPLLGLYLGNIACAQVQSSPCSPWSSGKHEQNSSPGTVLQKNPTYLPWSECVLDRAVCLTSLSLLSLRFCVVSTYLDTKELT